MQKFNLNMLTFNADGLIPAIAQDHQSNEVLMMAWMNKGAILETLKTKRVTYWSRSRQKLWVKGETSGHIQTLTNLYIDCDQDCLLVKVRQFGPACHTNRRSCFYFEMIDEDKTIEILDPQI